MNYDHDAIRKAYPDVVMIDDAAGIFDKDGNVFTVEQSKVNEARVELDKLNYRGKRSLNYPNIGDQLDNIYKAIDADSDLKSKFAAFHAAIKAVKDAHPKP